jgi:hypothetical protein
MAPRGSMADEPDYYQLEAIAEEHAIAAGMLVPLAIARLAGLKGASEAVLAVELRDIGGPGEARRTLRLKWRRESATHQGPALPERSVTEWAACVVACAVVFRYGGMRVSQVTADGDGFDYWVTDGEREYALEVSGTQRADIESRHRSKVRQLQANPYEVDGYVVVVGFSARAVVFSFHRFGEIRA